MLLRGLRKKIESKRSSDKSIWKFMVWTKDFLYFSWEEFMQMCGRMGDSTIKIERLDSQRIPRNKKEILAFFVVRNEAMRLPSILDYYAKKGVDRFFIIDNGSTDGTVEFLLSQRNVHVFKSNESFGESHFGNSWRRYLMKKHAIGHWCIIADADEMIIYPHYEKVSLKDLCSFLDKEGATAVNTLLLDMYSEKPITSTVYRKSDDLLSSFPYFDGTRDNISQEFIYGRYWHRGGMRKRVFGIDSLLNKTGIVKYGYGVIIHDGHHSAAGVRTSHIEGCVLHFKYTPDFARLVTEEAEREEHWEGAKEYKEMVRMIRENPNFTIHYPGSVRFKNSAQLVKLGLMKTSDAFEKYVNNANGRV